MSLLNQTIILFLVFSRLSGIFLLTPVFGNRAIPLQIKLGFSFFLTFITMPLVTVEGIAYNESFLFFFYFLITEFMIGLLFGFVSMLILNSIYLTGLLIDNNIGFSIVNVLSPEDESEIPITANLFYTLAILVFLITNSHHTLIKAIIYSFKVLPLGYKASNLILLDKTIEILKTSFILGFKMASPIIITIFITNVLLGILSRTIPQMNVFIVGMPLKILIGIITIFVVFPLYSGIFKNIFSMLFDYISDFVNSAPKG